MNPKGSYYVRTQRIPGQDWPASEIHTAEQIFYCITHRQKCQLILTKAPTSRKYSIFFLLL